MAHYQRKTRTQYGLLFLRKESSDHYGKEIEKDAIGMITHLLQATGAKEIELYISSPSLLSCSALHTQSLIAVVRRGFDQLEFPFDLCLTNAFDLNGLLGKENFLVFPHSNDTVNLFDLLIHLNDKAKNETIRTTSKESHLLPFQIQPPLYISMAGLSKPRTE